MRVDGKVAVVTGAASGIGRATALLLAREGATVIMADRDAPAVRQLASQIGRSAMDFPADVSVGSAVSQLFDMVGTCFGRLDILLNNAGIGLSGTVEETEEADWDRLMGVNLRSVYLCSRHALPLMRASGGGSIINMGSYTAASAIPARAAYVASKGAIHALTRAMAIDHAHEGIRVNAVAPGTTDTPYFAHLRSAAHDEDALLSTLGGRAPMKRLGRPEEIAEMVLFLASNASSFATGAVFTVDGGSSAW